MRRLVACLGVLLSVGVWGAPPAEAHAVLRSSVPADGAIVHHGPEAVRLSFSQAPDLEVSSVQVRDSRGTPVADQPMERVPGRPQTVLVPLRPLSPGVYTVRWRVLSVVDGDLTSGALTFGVREAVPEHVHPDPPVVPGTSVLDAAGRALFYAGLVGVLGAVAIGLVVLRCDQPTVLVRSSILAWFLATLGFLGLVRAKYSAADVELDMLLDASVGRALLLRGGGLLVAGLGILMATAAKRLRLGLALAGAGAAGTVLAHVWSGHAAGGAPGLMVGLQWIHLVAVGAWIGGLGTLLLVLRDRPNLAAIGAVRRFSALAGVALAIVALTGVVRAVEEVGAWSRLTSSSYGRLVLVKAGIFLALGLLGAVNRYVNVPAAGHRLQGLRRVGATEVAVAVGALAVTGVLSTKAPPVVLASVAPPSEVVATGADLGTTVRANLTISPGLPGPNHFMLRMTDYDTGRPVTSDRVTLRLELPGPTDRGESTLELSPHLAGAYGAHGPHLSEVGRWQVVVVAERGAHSVEIPLEVPVASGRRSLGGLS